MAKYIGIDLGGTNIVAALFDENFKMISKASCKTNLPKSADQISAEMEKLSNSVLKKAAVDWNEVLAVGVGAPGVIDSKNGLVKNSCNFNYTNEPLALLLQNRIKKKTYIENDANVAALGEFYHRKKFESDLSSMVLLTLGTGVGGGIVIGSKIYSGFNFCGAEIGHMVIKKGGRLCNCGRRGCFETYASATGLLKTTKEFMEADETSKLWRFCSGGKKLSAKNAFDAARQGDEVALKIKRRFVSDLGEGVVNVVNIFQPQLVCIGGGISKEGKLLIEPLQEFVSRFDYAKNVEKRCRVEACILKNDAGLVGAAMLCKV